MVVGGQYGDEGKGRIIDDLAPYVDVIVRFSGANNAGHTVVVNGRKYVFHSLPSGVLHAHCTNINGPGFLTNIEQAPKELEQILAQGIAPKLSWDVHSQVIMPWHTLIDRGKEEYRASKNGRKIGTTGSGVGPAAESRADRVTAFELADLLGTEQQIKEKIYMHITDPELLLKLVAYHPRFRQFQSHSFEFILEAQKGSPLELELRNYAAEVALLIHENMRILEPYLFHDTSLIVNSPHNRAVLFEGAQGTELDTIKGKKPYTTSTPTLSYGACLAGIGPNKITDILGVFKAYVTRVGGGLLETELQGELSEYIRKRGNEYGATTARPRRPGWFNIPEAIEAVRWNGMTGAIITKLDILDELEVIQVGIERNSKGLGYTSKQGWREDSGLCKTWDDLFSVRANPQRKEYLQFLEKSMGVPIVGVCIGDKRGQFILQPGFQRYLAELGVLSPS